MHVGTQTTDISAEGAGVAGRTQWGVAASIIIVHQTWSAIDLAYINNCADVEDDEVNRIVEACHKYTAAYYLITMMNKYVLNMLSFNIHLKYEIPFEYIQEQIWARKLQNTGCRMPYSEEGWE